MSILSNREKKFLANQKQMTEIFGDFVPQGTAFYEFCRGYDTEDRILQRMNVVRLKMYSGICKKRRDFASLKDGRNVQMFGVRAVRLDEEDAELEMLKNSYKQQAQARMRVRANIYNFATPLQHTRFFVLNADARQRGRQCRQQNGLISVRFLGIQLYSYADIARLFWLVYRELGQSMAPCGTQVLDDRSVRLLNIRPTPPKIAEQSVDFVGQFALTGRAVNKDGSIGRIVWQNTSLQMLDDGVKSLIATVCVENDLMTNNTLDSCPCGFGAIMAKIRQTIPSLPAFYLAGLWNAVADDELIRQHFGVGCADEEVWQATEIFKQFFADYINSVFGNNSEAKTKRDFTAEIGKKIVRNYLRCVNFCVQQYEVWAKRKIRHSPAWGRFVEFLELATNCEFDSLVLGKFSEIDEVSSEQFSTLLRVKLLKIRESLDNIVTFDGEFLASHRTGVVERQKREAKA